MRIATLQYAPKLGDVDGNIQKANEILERGKSLSLDGRKPLGVGIGVDLLRPDLLVLPELALTGYNFPSLDAIRPYLEPAGTGPSAAWAQDTAKRLQCTVCVGYPEIEDSADASLPAKYYNSLIVVDEHGQVIHNYRKSFLYFTDETWAAEGNVERGFRELTFRAREELESSRTTERVDDTLRDTAAAASANGRPAPEEDKRVATSFGICMDINPYKFEAPFTAFEFANRVLDSQSQLVILSMAWLTHASREELAALDGAPEMDTFNYWLLRLRPLFEKQMRHARDLDGQAAGVDADAPKKLVVVFANRAGEEPAADDTKPPARYAGTSTVLAVTQRPAARGSREGVIDVEPALDVKILCWDMLGATEEGICFADTTANPKMVFALRKSASTSESESE
ncbi:Carbon-nitrogen hydrolase [Penicillium hispanicum]|uniref:Carbon-nitrogen hydrolase n=1 Tax=Penicillium hispanicum TaxID=1080232 RepID=UPI00254072C5|nr:Carbon-nitrogen hydrolase [Penicillium hispanicum]KAJ5573880.1 Carbon-nitrogen hydrolase [Penicillium hispanicum]